MNRRIRRVIISAVGVACVVCCISTRAEGTIPLIPGTEVPLAVLPDAVEWEFGVRADSAGVERHRFLDSEGPVPKEVTVYRFKSAEPYGERGDNGYTFLRFSLAAFRFENDSEAKSAIGDLIPTDGRRIHTYVCFGGGYFRQRGSWVYDLDVPCLFSRSNYQRIVDALDVALQGVGAEPGRALQCFCGGSWREPAIE